MQFRTRFVVATITAGALAVAPIAAATVTGVGVLTGAVNERNPAAAWSDASQSTHYLAWSQNSAGAPNHYDAYFRSGSGTPVKLNLKGQGWTGGIDGAAGLVVYQRIYNGQSDIKLYDINAGTWPSFPNGFSPNTTRWEWHPTIAGDYVLFNRDDVSTPTERVVVYRLSTGQVTQLDTTTAQTSALYAGQVNGNWAVWTKCNPRCKVYRDDLSSLPTVAPQLLERPAVNPLPQQYGAGVTSTGVVYLARSGTTCGSNVKIVRYFGADPSSGTPDPATGTVIWNVAFGRDLTFGYARENPVDSSVDYFYDRITCNSAQWDVYKITDGP
jgi:hypothetical protein